MVPVSGGSVPAAPRGCPNHVSIKALLFVQAAEQCGLCGQPRTLPRAGASSAAVPGFWCSPGITGPTMRICGHGEGLEVPWGLHSFKHCQIPCWSGLWGFFLCSSQFPVIFSCGPGPWCWGAVQEELTLLAAPTSTTAAELGACTHPNWEAAGEGVGSF